MMINSLSGLPAEEYGNIKVKIIIYFACNSLKYSGNQIVDAVRRQLTWNHIENVSGSNAIG
jgi:hypothetical protein